jgi:hypothetical protein
MLMLVTEHDESLQAFEAFKRAFAAGAALFPKHVVSVPSGNFQVDFYWHRLRSDGIWGGFRKQVWDPPSKKELDIFGNSFGGPQPAISAPHDGRDQPAP